ncbi:winged helix-turn-helix transcriptional regulator [Granulicella arctica]|uniref:DNA-binding HxlR family transcriptional regulator n=1 Tax=Granulicella arctica TaxID=940613 RepID=A0A7Y9PIM7_9BACT|nr:helix-turn-helix domain-containing protein [Granulicella arctica]NYF80602.1 DNA-binding HxlR family transcriptional regulator [Granulicella arctica]
MSATNKAVCFAVKTPGDCKSLVQILSRVGDKWTIMVVGSLADGPRRYNEIQRFIGEISQRMLTLTLKGLEQDGLVNRTVFPTIPPRVDYELTARGKSLLAPLQALFAWAAKNKSAIETSREKFSARKVTPENSRG